MISGLAEASGAALPDPASAAIKLDARAYDRALSCVRCGLCLPACPTYTQNGMEADSPRGRIILMKGLADGRIGPSQSVLHHLDLCLDCRACEAVCPSGVVYHELIEETRQHLQAKRRRGPVDRLVRVWTMHVLAFPRRLKCTLLPVRLLQKMHLWNLLCRVPLPGAQLDKMRRMMPPRGPLWERRLGETSPAKPPPPPVGLTPAPAGQRLRNAPPMQVGFFAGCVSSVLEQEVNRQAIALLCHAGCEVVAPRGQGCCGAIHYHAGRPGRARRLARANMDAFLPEASDPSAWARLPYIVTGVAGCGAMLKEYGYLFRDDPQQAERAGEFARRVRDVHQLLVRLPLPRPQGKIKLRATYHDACHLAHAQGVADAPRQLLAMIPGLELVALPESDMCCGAAGTYNLQEPQMARELAERKLRHIQETGATVCIMANIGCALQLGSEARRLGVKIEIMHPITLLYRSMFPEA
jgi:glycolate oxidase iron-sulfur subunit